MFCIKCGAKNSDEAIYCQKCGVLLEAEEETRIARSVKTESNEPEEAEKQIFSINPTLTFVKIGYGLAIFGALLLVAVFNLYRTSNPRFVLPLREACRTSGNKQLRQNFPRRILCKT